MVQIGTPVGADSRWSCPLCGCNLRFLIDFSAPFASEFLRTHGDVNPPNSREGVYS